MDRADELDGLVGRGVFTTQDALAVGLTHGRLAHEVAHDVVVRVRRGCYVGAARWRSAAPGERHLLRVRAAAQEMPGAVFSHASAAAVWGLPRVGAWPSSIEVATQRRGGGRSKPGVVRRDSTNEVPAVQVDGLLVTGPARTVVDLARTSTFVTGLAAADHALHHQLTTHADLAAALDELGTRRGARAARRVLEHASGLAESAGESLSRGRMIEIGIPLPTLQQPLKDVRGPVGRVDFWWRHLRLIGEFDGRIKYRVDGVEDRRALEERLWAEKLREDRLRAGGARMVRWTWDVALDRNRFAAHLATAGLTATR